MLNASISDKPVLQTGVWEELQRSQEGACLPSGKLDGLGSVLRPIFGTVVPATPLPTRRHILASKPKRTNGSDGAFLSVRKV